MNKSYSALSVSSTLIQSTFITLGSRVPNSIITIEIVKMCVVLECLCYINCKYFDELTVYDKILRGKLSWIAYCKNHPSNAS